MTQPASADVSDQIDEEEEDWQQLSALPQASGAGKESVQRSSPAMYVDHSAAGSEPMGFRELFLRSCALENLLAGKHKCHTPHLQAEQGL